MKKINLILFIAILCSIFIYSFINIQNKNELQSPQNISTTVGWGNNFTMGVMNDEPNNYGNNYQDVKQMELNLSHGYLGSDTDGNGRHYPKGRIANDGVLNDVNDYKSGVTTIMNNVASSTNGGRKMMMQRPKIEWLCYGQSSTYQCEETLHGQDTAVWFYSFNDHPVGTDVLDSGRYVRYCQVNTNQTDRGAGWVVKRLKANTEQSNKSEDQAWKGDNECTWYVKPRIRVDADFVNNFANDNQVICKIKLRDENDILFKQIDIRAKDFRPGIFDNYNGQYLEEFFFSVQSDTSRQDFKGALGTKHFFDARGTCANDNSVSNKADIQVEWTGLCDMWIDYVKVENDVADKLLKGFYNDPTHPENEWIKQEATQIAHGTSSPDAYATKFYIELAEFNNLPCIKYVNDILGQYNVSVVSDFNAYSPLVHVSYNDRARVSNAEWLYHNYILRGGFSEIYAETYPMSSRYNDPIDDKCFSKVPNTLPKSTGYKILAKSVPPAEYDTWLDEDLETPYWLEQSGGTGGGFGGEENNTNCSSDLGWDKGNFGYIMRIGNAISRLGNIPFILMPQGHYWYRLGEVRREPTNEELEMMANVAISYSAKGLVYFQFNSWDGTDNGCPFSTRGFQKRPDEAGYPGLLDTNLFNQAPKWKTVRDISRRVKKWEPYLMNFDNTTIHSYYYVNSTERTSLLGTYFNDVITFKPGSTTPCSESSSPSSTVAECPDDRYLQIATFDKAGESDTKYFMIVNRRCSPIKSGSPDGKRFVRIKFDANSSSFANFNNWKIIDLEDNSTVLTFDKRMTSNLDLGWFNPGQGRLYKIIPVMTEGGTLVGDESFSNVTFNCNGSVTANVNKNIIIGETLQSILKIVLEYL